MRKELRDGLRKLFAAGMKTTNLDDGFPADSLIVATRAKDFDLASNDEWDLDANKSYVRSVCCWLCGNQLVMSNGMWTAYQNKGGKPEMLRCGECVFKAMKEADLSPTDS